jgi:hypothetical protein
MAGSRLPGAFHLWMICFHENRCCSYLGAKADSQAYLIRWRRWRAIYEQQQRHRAVRATYDALLAAGAPEKLACAAALNPEVLRSVAPIYFGHKPQ